MTEYSELLLHNPLWSVPFWSPGDVSCSSKKKIYIRDFIITKNEYVIGKAPDICINCWLKLNLLVCPDVPVNRGPGPRAAATSVFQRSGCSCRTHRPHRHAEWEGRLWERLQCGSSQQEQVWNLSITHTYSFRWQMIHILFSSVASSWSLQQTSRSTVGPG